MTKHFKILVCSNILKSEIAKTNSTLHDEHSYGAFSGEGSSNYGLQ